MPELNATGVKIGKQVNRISTCITCRHYKKRATSWPCYPCIFLPIGEMFRFYERHCWPVRMFNIAMDYIKQGAKLPL